ncbi:MAG: hypothetical protein ABJA64_02000 [Candidatus Saccharibacteria bacterium]
MWEHFTRNPLGSLSMRKYLRFATALLVACFLYIIVTTPSAFAADAQWKGDSTITYEGHDYTGPKTANKDSIPPLPEGMTYFTYADKTTSTTDASTKGYAIYFAPGNDSGAASSAQYITYTSNGLSFKELTAPKAITIDTTSADASTTPSKGTSSCDIDHIGWLICPVTDFMAWGMDTLYSALSNFLRVAPIESGNNSLYRAWGVMRNFANIAFVIAFMLVIYSYLVGGGLSNYNLKKMLPRLIIAAILVNISYWICAIAVDISNILGQSVQDLFMQMRDQVVGTEKNSNFDWTEISSYVLSGGAIGGIGLIAATGGSIVSGIFLLLGALVTVLFAGFIAIVVLAARQALITILIIIAPLAFVAYLLPNTEKWFEKWRDVLTTMLVLFPIFSAIFGGSQLAGAAIVQNADNLSVLILGMAVQVAPLVITPLLIRFSGGIVGKIAGMANDRSKGVVDGARNWAKSNQEFHKQRSLGTPTRRRNAFRRTAQAMDRGRMYREGMTKNYQSRAENMFNDSAKGERLHEENYWAESDKTRVGKRLETDLSRKIRNNKGLLEREMKVRLTVDQAEAANQRLDAIQQELKAGDWSAFGYGPQFRPIMSIVDGNKEAARDLALTGMRKQNADTALKSQLTKDLLANTQQLDGKALRDYAGGIRGIAGAETVLATSVATSRKEYGERIGEKTELIKHFNLESAKRQDLAMGTDVMVTRSGVTYTFKANDEFAREAAIEEQLRTGSFGDKLNIINASGVGGATHDYRTTISSAVASGGLDSSALFWGAKTIDDISQGKYNGTSGQAEAIIYHIKQGKIKDEKLALQDASAVESLFEVKSTAEYGALTAPDRAQFDARYEALKQKAGKVLDEPELRKLASQSTIEMLERYRA